MVYCLGYRLQTQKDENQMTDQKTIFANRTAAPFLALLTAFVWGAAYPFIKLGLARFAIDNADTGAKTLFAGIRFSAAGLVVLIMWYLSVVRKEAAGNIRKAAGVVTSGVFSNALWLFLFALVNTALHYFCFYIGLSYSSGSRASVLNSLGTFLLVLLSCAVFREEHLTGSRILGCIVGFSGLLLLNLSGGDSGAFTLLGDGMIIGNALCSAFGGILTRIVGRKMNALFMTGAGLLIGGLLLIAGGLALGGRITEVTPVGLLDLGVLVSISVIGFSVYNELLQYHPVGKIAIFSSLIPVFGIILSCLLLGEPFLLKYIAAAALVSAGVYIINRGKT